MIEYSQCRYAHYVDNWFYGYQVYCTQPTEYWLNIGGWIILSIIIIYWIISFYNWKNQP